MRFVIFILCVVLGLAMMQYSKWLVDNGLRSAWAEEHLPLGSYSGVKLLGFIVLAFGVLYLFGLI